MNMKKKMLFISFFDSFEENIISFLSDNFVVTKISYEEINVNQPDFLMYECYCFGPGPGNIVEYQEYCLEFINILYQSKKPLIGICLGHQLLLGILRGAQIVKSKNLVHGQIVKLLDDDLNLVARYNSWTVEIAKNYQEYCVFDEFGELAYFRDNQLLTMQFHPESVGTSCPDKFFAMIAEFVMHNISDERV